MSFVLLSQIQVRDRDTTRTIALYEGDLAAIPPDHTLDLLIVSAFQDDHIPTPTSLIGSLAGRGLSVAELAADKACDLRKQCAFWLSKPIDQSELNMRRLACFESQMLGQPTALVGDLFRGLFPFIDPDKDQVVGLPLLSTGDQGWPKRDMMMALLDAATHWLSRGLPISELKIVVRPSPSNAALIDIMRRFRPKDEPSAAPLTDVFLSYSSLDLDIATRAEQELLSRSDVSKVFNFRLDIQVGTSWQREIDTAIHGARALVALVSPDYLKSPECQEELMVARLRHKHDGPFLYPIWWRGGDLGIDQWLRTINIADCREANADTLATSIARMSLC
ncbi:MAG: toll/interleukin-1 receptor domain-containing protein [Rhodobacteraceae bacterium]|nr:toll/interleukin-1 receptor domain-containing protein [Paracoccaceae bacterium]